MIFYLKAARILETKKIFNDTLADCWLKCGILLMSGNDLSQAFQYFQKVIYLVHLHNELPDSLLFKPYMYAGSVQYALNNLDSAVYFYKKAEAIYIVHPELEESERLFNKFGALYFETGDYNKSISYFEKALNLVREQSPANTFFIINYKNNIATALMKLGKYDQALKIFRDLLTYGNPPDELLYNTGNTYFEKGDYIQARKWLGLIRKMNFEKFTSLTKIYIYLREYDSAQIYLSKAKGLYNLRSGVPSGLLLGIIQKYSGDLERAKGNPKEALFDYQKSILSLDQSFKDESLSANPTSFEGFQNFSFLFDALVAKAATFKSMGDQDFHFIEQSIHAYESALTLAKHIEKTYFSDDARLFLKNKVNPATGDAVDVAIQLYYKTKEVHYIHTAFSLIENNKATVLQAGIRSLELNSISGLPTHLVAEEKKLRALLAKLQIQAIQVEEQHSPVEPDKKIHDMEVALASVQDKLDENSVYHKLKFLGSSPDMHSLQQNIKNANDAILCYYYTSSNLICFYITKEGSGFTSIPLQKQLFSSIAAFRKEVQQPEATGRKFLKYAGTTMFKSLISPVYEKIKGKKHLVIIPFNEISYVPFEMMVNPSDGSLLLKEFSISYNYSATFLSENKTEKRVQYQVLAMAPFTEKSDALVLPALPASLEEIEGLPGKKISGPLATKMQFESLAGLFPIIHLATHAVANDSNLLGTYIAFYGLINQADTLYRLYEQEIYTLDLKSARLVILSACETGNGMLVNSEGIISLSRAFSYAGCKSVITSLWKADELSTTFIVKRLHSYLQMGLAVDDALRKAKVDYLESNDIEERYKSPAYWAHLVLIGNAEPVTNSKIGWPFEVALIILFILFTYLFIKKTRHIFMPG